MHENSSGGMGFSMAGFLCSMIVPRYSSPPFPACNLASFSGRYSGEGRLSVALLLFPENWPNMGRGFWVAWLGSGASSWTVCWAQGGEILWAWGPIGKWKESQDDKAAHYHCPLHHTLKISCGPQHVLLSGPCFAAIVDTFFMQNIRKIVLVWLLWRPDEIVYGIWKVGYESTSMFIKQFEKGRGSKNIVDLDIPLALPQRQRGGLCVPRGVPWGRDIRSEEPGPFPSPHS